MTTRKNYLYQVLCELITTLIPLLTMPYVTRVLGTERLGSYQYVQTAASYFVLFANFGVKTYGNRCIAAVRDDQDSRNRVFSEIFTGQLILSLTVGVLYFLFALLFGGEYRALYAVFGMNLVSAVLEITWLYYGMERFRMTALVTIASRILVAAGIFLFVKQPDDLWVYAVLCSAGVLFVQLALWLRVPSMVRYVQVKPQKLIRHFLPCLALLLPALAPTLYRSMDKLMLLSVGEGAVGLYGAAEQLETCMLGFITGLGTVMLPRISHLLSKRREDDADRAVALSIQFSVFLGSAFAFGIASVAPVFVPFYYGATFAEAALLTVALSPTILFLSFTDVIRTQYIIPHKRDRIFVVSVLGGALVNLLANFLLIPVFSESCDMFGLSVDAAGALGAIPGTLLAELSVALVQYAFLHGTVPFSLYLRNCIVFPVAGAGMLLIVRVLDLLLSGYAALPRLFAEVAIGAMFYLLITGGWYFLFRRDALKLLFSHRGEE